MLAIQRQSGNHEGTIFFKFTYLFNMDDCLAKKKSRVLDFQAEPSKNKKNRDWLLNRARYERCRRIILHRRHSSIKV